MEVQHSPSVKTFVYLLLCNKLLTKEIMVRRNFNRQDVFCLMCASNHLETVQHLFLHCSYAMAIWAEVERMASLRMVSAGDSTFNETWRRSSVLYKGRPRLHARWKQIFEGKRVPTDLVAQWEWVIRDSTLWEKIDGRRAV